MNTRDIGNKIKNLRKERGLTQSNLAEILNITYQQVQKYESGRSNINISKLIEICKALKIPITFFFSQTESDKIADSGNKNEYNTGKTVYISKEEEKLLLLFRQIHNKEIQAGILKQIKGLIKK